MSQDDDIKIGPLVDEELWQDFKDEVRERTGKTRGTVGIELEKAIRMYLERTELSQIEDKVETIRQNQKRILELVGASDGDTDD